MASLVRRERWVQAHPQLMVLPTRTAKDHWMIDEMEAALPPIDEPYSEDETMADAVEYNLPDDDVIMAGH